MKKLHMLDVSLRDGGYRTNFHFKNAQLKQILSSLDESGIEYIEIGYRNGLLLNNDLGRAGLCHKDYLNDCASWIKRAKMVVMLYPGNVQFEDLQELKQHRVDMIRICIAKNQMPEAGELAHMARQLDFKISFNLTGMSQYQKNELDAMIEKALQYKPDIIYLADSNGSMLPEKVDSIYQSLNRQYSVPFGFHAHDNLGLAQANAISAINAGVEFIDASLAGMGKGIGNLKTEFFAAYLQAVKLKQYDLDALLSAANYARKSLGIGQEAIELLEFHRGIFDLN
ncbi:4-hydroxy-2-oxovalerate aldolase [Legionella jordanis]|nr:4-hydroxy-2-oxovalerate aldolase [Legionella jordanis]RMX03921.1 4-hydroxy-2-oxovalerate aldolase [Legionella jordanis]HAT8712696.1 4-hydroxy-2-oxovalerate aldolase [Legionella jordanis]